MTASVKAVGGLDWMTRPSLRNAPLLPPHCSLGEELSETFSAKCHCGFQHGLRNAGCGNEKPFPFIGFVQNHPDTYSLLS